MIGKTISHYKILEELGRGGRGVVYKAEDLNIGRIVAIKFLHSHLKRDEEAISRFVNEAKAASALDHTNIGILYEVDTTAEGEIFIVMAYYESGTLRERIDRGEMSTEEVLYIATQIASGLACAHDNGIVHRDIKPSNIILTRDKEIKIIDFGLAKLAGKTKLTKDGSTLGTAAYMSPEQARGEEVDHRSDIFSLGSILYEMISGERPFKGEHEAALLYEIVHEEPDPLMQYRSDIPQRLQEITDKALAKDVADRYQSAKELLAAIEGLDRVTSPETGIGTCKKRRVSKSGLISIIASIAAVAVVALFTLYPKFLKPVDQESASHATREIFSIVVAPFWGQNERAAEEGRVMQALHARKLSEMLGEEKNTKIILADAENMPHSHEEAKTLGRRLGASMVIWGIVLVLDGEVEIQPYISMIPSLTDIHDQMLQLKSLQTGIMDPNPLESRKEKAGETGNAVLLATANYYKYKNPEKALSVIQRLPNTEQQRFIVQGDVLFNMGNQDEAIGSYQKAASLAPQNPSPHLRLGWTYRMTGSYDEAELEYLRAIELNENYPWARVALADFYATVDKKDLALAAIGEALALEPQDAETYTYIGYAYWLMGFYREAIDQYRKAITFSPKNAQIRCDLGSAYKALGDDEQSIVEYKDAIKLAPLDPLPRYYLGIVCHDRGLYEEALEHLLKARELDPTDFSKYIILGNTYAKLGDREKAIENFNEASIHAKDGGAQFIVHIGVGNNYRELGWYDEAVAEFEKEIKSFPEGDHAHYYLALTYEEMGKYEAALDEYKKAMELEPSIGLEIRNKLQYFLSLCRFGRHEEAKIFMHDCADEFKILKWHMEPEFFETILDFYAGMITEEEVLEEANHREQGQDSKFNRCLAHYYIAMARLLNIEGDSAATASDTVVAHEHLANCIELCGGEAGSEYHDRAEKELKRR